jgi:hypothetical protein
MPCGPTSPTVEGRLIVQPDEMAGKNSAEKRHEMADWLHQEGADAAVLAALDSIAWTFNVRGADVTHTPVALAYALVNADGTADLFVEGEKVGDDVRSTSATASAARARPVRDLPALAEWQADRGRSGAVGRGDRPGTGGRRGANPVAARSGGAA